MGVIIEQRSPDTPDPVKVAESVSRFLAAAQTLPMFAGGSPPLRV